jgi:hypothetical protein
MHHGTHEKQISNVFRWLLETEGNHHLGDTFLRIFIDEVNRGLVGREPFAPAAYLVPAGRIRHARWRLRADLAARAQALPLPPAEHAA